MATTIVWRPAGSGAYERDDGARITYHQNAGLLHWRLSMVGAVPFRFFRGLAEAKEAASPNTPQPTVVPEHWAVVDGQTWDGKGRTKCLTCGEPVIMLRNLEVHWGFGR